MIVHLRSEYRRLDIIRIVITVHTIFFLIFTFSAYGIKKINGIFLIPTPDVYDEDTINPFTNNELLKLPHKAPYRGILYATDRKPATGEDKFYSNSRGHLLRIGIADSLIKGLNLGPSEVKTAAPAKPFDIKD